MATHLTMGNEVSVEDVNNKVCAYAVLAYQIKRGKAGGLAGLSREEVERTIKDPQWADRVESFVDRLRKDGKIEGFLQETFATLVEGKGAQRGGGGGGKKKAAATRKYVEDEEDEEEYVAPRKLGRDEPRAVANSRAVPTYEQEEYDDDSDQSASDLELDD